jgi:hypothetical protein
MHNYWGFGLHIASEIEFPELLPFDFEEADVTITIGKTPDALEGEDVVQKPMSSISKDEYLLNVRDICRYYAGHGTKIVAEPVAGMDEHSIRLFMLGTVMAAILYQRGDIPLHASAIVKDGKLTLFAGNSGAGKSTLLAMLATKGYEVFTDDVCVLQHNTTGTNEVLGTASYPMIKLWDDAISQLDNDTFTRDFKVRPLLPKYGQFFYDTFNAQALPVDKIFVLSPENSATEISVERLINVQAFKKLEKQAYKFQLITNTRLRTLHFSLLSQITNHIPVFEVRRPISGTNVEALCNTLEKLL